MKELSPLSSPQVVASAYGILMAPISETAQLHLYIRNSSLVSRYHYTNTASSRYQYRSAIPSTTLERPIFAVGTRPCRREERAQGRAGCSPCTLFTNLSGVSSRLEIVSNGKRIRYGYQVDGFHYFSECFCFSVAIFSLISLCQTVKYI